MRARPWLRQPAGRWLRALPFATAAAFSLAIAARAPRGRRPFILNFDLSPHMLAYVALKPDHLLASGLLCLLAIAALGRRRLLVAVGMTLLVGVGWELAQATVTGRLARAADLLPNFLGASAAALGYLAVRTVVVTIVGPRPSPLVHEDRTVMSRDCVVS